MEMALRHCAHAAIALGMKRLLIGFTFALLVAEGAVAAEGKFTSTLSPADLEAAGLQALTPEQLARLNALVENYKNGAVAAATPPVQTPSPARPVSPAARSAKSSQAKPVPSGGLITQMKGWMKRSAEEPPPVVESTIPGKFRGWDPRQVFLLANGEQWRVANNENYYTPAVENPRVFIVPANTGGYWMQFPDLKIQVRVQPLIER
jgi:hypothetical protein